MSWVEFAVGPLQWCPSSKHLQWKHPDLPGTHRDPPGNRCHSNVVVHRFFGSEIPRPITTGLHVKTLVKHGISTTQPTKTSTGELVNRWISEASTSYRKGGSKKHLPGSSTLSALFWDVDLHPNSKVGWPLAPFGDLFGHGLNYLVGWFAVKSFETKVDNICFEQHFENLHCLGW